MKRKPVIILIMVLMMTLMAFSVASADDVKATVDGYASQGGAVIAEEISKISTQLIDLARGVFVMLAVVFLIWAGFVYWGSSGDPNKMMLAKKMLAGFVVCMIFVFMAEKILGAILGIIGYGV